MPRNTKGGNKAKRGANKNFIEKKLEYATPGQYYGVVTKYNGSGRCDLLYILTNNDEIKEMNVKGLVRGSIKKKCRLNNGDIVLVSPRDYQNDVVDILHKYITEDIQKLNNYGELHKNLINLRDNISSKGKMNDNNEVNFEINTDDELDDIIENNKQHKKINYSSIYDELPSFSSDDDN